MSLSKSKVFLISSSRSDYGILENLINKLVSNKKFETYLLVTGSHFNKKLGYSYKKIKLSDKNKLLKLRIKSDGNTIESSLEIMSEIFKKFKFLIKKYNPELIIILGDRYEILPFAIISHFYKIKIAHIHGGELTYGSIDDSIRHSITKFSDIHFVSNEIYKKRVNQLGEMKHTIHNVGSLALEKLNKKNLYKKRELQEKLNFKFLKKNILIVVHPVTYSDSNNEKYNQIFIERILNSVSKFNDTMLIFSKPNSDFGYQKIIKKLVNFTEKNSNAILLDNLGSKLFMSLLNNVDMILGNSSAGIIEAPSFKIPTINIGDRQKGRLRADSVIDCNLREKDIIEKIKIAYSNKFKNKLNEIKNPYFKKNTSDKIIKILNRKIKEKFKFKEFYDL